MTTSSVIPISGAQLPATPSPEPNERKSVDVLDDARRIVIRNPIEYLGACDAKLAIDDMIRNRHSVHDPAVAKAYESHQAACRARSQDIDPLTEAKRLYQRAIDKWQHDQDEIAAAARRRQQEAEELKALEAREKEIVEAEAAGAQPEEIQSLSSRPVYVPPPVVHQRPAAVPAVKGIRRSAANWKSALDPKDPRAMAKLVMFISTNPQYENLLQINQSAADALAKGLKELMSIPGLVAYDAAKNV